MAICKYWRRGHCRYEGFCHYEHPTSSSATSPLVNPAPSSSSSMVWKFGSSSRRATSASISLTSSPSDDNSEELDQAKPSEVVEGSATSPEHPASSSTDPVIPSAYQSSEIPINASTIPKKAITTSSSTGPNPPDLPAVKDNEGDTNVALLREKIAQQEDIVQKLEAAADPERQHFKNKILHEELIKVTERNHDLQVEVQLFTTREASLRVELDALKGQISSVDKEAEIRALTKDVESIQSEHTSLIKKWDHERTAGDVLRKKSEAYLKALEKMIAANTKTNKTTIKLIREIKASSKAGTYATAQDKDTSSIKALPSTAPGSDSPSTNSLQLAPSNASLPTFSLKPESGPVFGSTSSLDVKGGVVGLNRPPFDFKALSGSTGSSIFHPGPVQPLSGVAQSSIVHCPFPTPPKLQLGVKRKVEDLEDNDTDLAQNGNDAAFGTISSQVKESKIARLEEISRTEDKEELKVKNEDAVG